MNLLNILDRLSDDQFFSKLTSRSESISHISDFGKKAVLASIPLGLSSLMATPSQAATTSVTGVAAASALTDALQLALVLEYLEDEYYRRGLAASGLIPADDKVVFQQISKHETAHVAFLKAAISSLGETPGTKPTFDFTAGGNFQPFSDYQQFMILAQAFEDTGVRAYKGQAGNVASNKAVLQAALQIHSVEARHASQVRRMRANKGWIENADGGNMPAATNPVYSGEGMVNQAGFNTSSLFGAAAGSASFDEVLSGSDAAAIAGLFIA